MSAVGQRLRPVDLAPFFSAYLAGGWRKDNLTLEHIDFEPGRLSAKLRVEDFFVPGDGVFHLSVPVAMIWISQLAIFYACLDQKLSRKPGEVYLRSMEIQCKRKITTTDSLLFLLEATATRKIPSSIYYAGTFDIDRGAFVGSANFVLPRPI